VGKIEMPVDVFQEAVAALAHEEVVVLATVIGTSGSTPAPVHARMLVKEEGRTSVGTVGGGRVERAVAVEAQRLFRRIPITICSAAGAWKFFLSR
jgi:xanthine/CO dehydrogenase XdhC/CoxF family maturation factor